MLKQKHTILAVDDEPANLRMLERLLRKDFTVLKAASAEEALQIIEKQPVSMIMTDQRMPGMTGTEFLRKSREILPHAVRMVVTGNTDSDTLIDAIRNAGAIRVITKPWDPDQVLNLVETALEKYEAFLESQRSITELKQAAIDLGKIATR